MTRLLTLTALALACVCSPALADAASEPVTWGGLGTVIGFGGLGIAALIFLCIVVAVIGGIIISAWSH